MQHRKHNKNASISPFRRTNPSTTLATELISKLLTPVRFISGPTLSSMSLVTSDPRALVYSPGKKHLRRRENNVIMWSIFVKQNIKRLAFSNMA